MCAYTHMYICIHTHLYDGVSGIQGSAQIHSVAKSDLDFWPSRLSFLNAGATAVCYTGSCGAEEWSPGLLACLAGRLHPEALPGYAMSSTSSCEKRQIVGSTGSCLRERRDTISSSTAGTTAPLKAENSQEYLSRLLEEAGSKNMESNRWPGPLHSVIWKHSRFSSSESSGFENT